MKVLIFGGNGFLGNAITTVLKSEGIDFKTVSRTNALSSYNIDISVFSAFELLPFNEFDVVVNCATILPGGHYLDNDYLDAVYSTNILGSQNICKWIDKQHTIKKIINCSTLVVVRKPWPIDLKEEDEKHPTGNHVLYAGSKLLQESIFETFSTEKAIDLIQIRFSALYGETMPWNGIICNLIDQARNTGKIVVSNATKVTADFLHVNDAASTLVTLMKSDQTGVLNVAAGIETSILRLAEITADTLPGEIEIENIENAGFTGSRAVVNIDKLKQHIDTRKFLSISEGIHKLMML